MCQTFKCGHFVIIKSGSGTFLSFLMSVFNKVKEQYSGFYEGWNIVASLKAWAPNILFFVPGGQAMAFNSTKGMFDSMFVGQENTNINIAT